MYRLSKRLTLLLLLFVTPPCQAGWNPFSSNWLESSPTPNHNYELTFVDDSIEEKIITLIEVTPDRQIIYTEADNPEQQRIACDQLSTVIEIDAPKTSRRTAIAAVVGFAAAVITGGASTVANGLLLLGGGTGYFTRGRSAEHFCSLALEEDIDDVHG